MFTEKVPPVIEIAPLILRPLAEKVSPWSKLSAPLVLCPPPPPPAEKVHVPVIELAL